MKSEGEKEDSELGSMEDMGAFCAYCCCCDCWWGREGGAVWSGGEGCVEVVDQVFWRRRNAAVVLLGEVAVGLRPVGERV